MTVPAAPPLLHVEHLTMRFGGLTAINALSFDALEGEITSLIGPNGAGKTTVFNCVTGFYQPTEGRIALRHGKIDMDKDLAEVTRHGVGRLKRRDGGTRKSAGRAAQPADGRLRLHGSRRARPRRLRPR
jgi:ABC-type uncharacterized transport system ATPase subunit